MSNHVLKFFVSQFTAGLVSEERFLRSATQGYKSSRTAKLHPSGGLEREFVNSLEDDPKSFVCGS